MRTIAFGTWTLSAVLGAIAVIFGYPSVATIAAHFALFGIAFYRIAVLQRALSTSLPRGTGGVSFRTGIVSLVLLSAGAVLWIIALSIYPIVWAVATYLVLFGVLFRGLERVHATVRQLPHDTTTEPPKA